MGGNYQILHIQIVKKLTVDGYLLTASGVPPYTSKLGACPKNEG